MVFDPWSSESSLRFWLGRLKEFGELDAYISHYLENVLGQKILARPSRGRYGEAGKDIVAVENEELGAYCSYVVKAGDLNKNLEGKYGVLKQMDDAMRVPLDEPTYHGKKRTIVVVHNGVEGNRGAIKKFEDAKAALESEFALVLLSPIQRWDLSDIARILFPHGAYFKEIEDYQNEIGRLDTSIEIVSKIRQNIPTLLPEISQAADTPLKTLLTQIFDSIEKAEKRFGPFKEGHKRANP